MSILENRVSKLEAELLKVRFEELSDDELRAYAYAQPFKSPKQYEALIALINRRGSAFPIIHDDPEWAVPESVSNQMEAKNANT